MRKFYSVTLVLLIVLIFLASKTSGLLVLQPETWLNHGSYSPYVHVTDLFNKNSSFYDGYFQNNNSLVDLDKEFLIRKLLHALTYALLAYLFIKSVGQQRFLLAPIFTFLIAFLDEINQYLLIGRSGRLADVMLDTTSGLVATFLVFLNILSTKKRQKKTS